LSEAEVTKYEKKLDNQVFDALREAINYKVKNINNLLEKRFVSALVFCNFMLIFSST